MCVSVCVRERERERDIPRAVPSTVSIKKPAATPGSKKRMSLGSKMAAQIST